MAPPCGGVRDEAGALRDGPRREMRKDLLLGPTVHSVVADMPDRHARIREQLGKHRALVARNRQMVHAPTGLKAQEGVDKAALGGRLCQPRRSTSAYSKPKDARARSIERSTRKPSRA